jgi:hypothetical protein
VSQDGESIGSGHTQVENQHVRLVLGHGAQRLHPIGASLDHLDVRLPLKKALQTGKHDRMVVGDDDPHGSLARVGNRSAGHLGAKMRRRGPDFNSSADRFF